MDKCEYCGGIGIVLRYPLELIPRGCGKSLFIPCPKCTGKTISTNIEIDINEKEKK